MAFPCMDKLRNKLIELCYGLVSHVPTIFVYGLWFAISMIVIDMAEKIRFTTTVNNELQQNTISQEVFDGVKMAINGASVFDSLGTTFAVALCFWAGQFFLRHATELNWSRTITLPAAIEFSSAMRKMGLFDFSDQMACVYKHRLRVYIAKTPLLVDQGEDVRAKLYRHAHNDILVLEDVLTKSIGKRLLCLDADEYNSTYQQYSQIDQTITLAKIAEQEKSIDALKGALSLIDDENKQLKSEKAQLDEEKAVLKLKLQTKPGREENISNTQEKRIAFWRVAGPLINRLITEAKPGTKYTCPQIQAEFLKELENYPELKLPIQTLLHTSKKEANDTPFDLDGWAMRLIRDGLGEYVKRAPGAPPKS